MSEPKKRRPPRKAQKPSESRALPVSYEVVPRASVKTTQRYLGLGAGWTIDAVLAARECQARGHFKQAVRLARTSKSEPAIYSALLQRIAPHRGLPRTITSPEPLTGSSEVIRLEAMATFCQDGVAISPGAQADCFESLALHGIAVCQLVWTTRDDGSRDDVVMLPFPLEFVEWSEPDRVLYALTLEGRVPIQHGDGRWVVFQVSDLAPWENGAIIPLARLWVDQSYARNDQSASSASHGDDKFIGTLPEGMTPESAEGQALLAQMEGLYEARKVLLKPFGSEIERMEAQNGNYQIFESILNAGSKNAARILLGQDGTMQTAGGDYLKSWGMFGIRTDIVEADLACVGRGIATGVIRPWSLRNFGRFDSLEYGWLLPDADQDARRKSLSEMTDAFHRAVKEAKEIGFIVDQAYVDHLAKEYGVTAPRLATSSIGEPAPAAA